MAFRFFVGRGVRRAEGGLSFRDVLGLACACLPSLDAPFGTSKDGTHFIEDLQALVDENFLDKREEK